MLIERLSDDVTAIAAGRRRLHAVDGYTGAAVHLAGGAGAEAVDGDAAGAWQVGR